MSLYTVAMQAIDSRDFDAVVALINEDFIWMNGYEMKTLNEWLQGLKTQPERDFVFTDRQFLFENEDICAY